MRKQTIPTIDRAVKLTRDFGALTDFQKELAIAYGQGLAAHDTPVQPEGPDERKSA